MSKLDSSARKLAKAHKRQLARSAAAVIGTTISTDGPRCITETDIGALETRPNPHGRSYIHTWEEAPRD